MTATNLDTINKEMSASDNNIIARHGLALITGYRLKDTARGSPSKRSGDAPFTVLIAETHAAILDRRTRNEACDESSHLNWALEDIYKDIRRRMTSHIRNSSIEAERLQIKRRIDNPGKLLEEEGPWFDWTQDWVKTGWATTKGMNKMMKNITELEGMIDGENKQPTNSCNLCETQRSHTTITPSTLILYTDGSHDSGKPQATAGFGYVGIRNGDAEKDEINCYIEVQGAGPVVTDYKSPVYLGARKHSNNTGELTALMEAMLWALEKDTQPHTPIIIRPDSELAMGWVIGDIIAHTNKDLVKKARQIYEKLLTQRNGKIWWKHVKGHSDHQRNDGADRLADEGAKMSPWEATVDREIWWKVRGDGGLKHNHHKGRNARLRTTIKWIDGNAHITQKLYAQEDCKGWNIGPNNQPWDTHNQISTEITTTVRIERANDAYGILNLLPLRNTNPTKIKDAIDHICNLLDGEAGTVGWIRQKEAQEKVLKAGIDLDNHTKQDKLVTLIDNKQTTTREIEAPVDINTLEKFIADPMSLAAHGKQNTTNHNGMKPNDTHRQSAKRLLKAINEDPTTRIDEKGITWITLKYKHCKIGDRLLASGHTRGSREYAEGTADPFKYGRQIRYITSHRFGSEYDDTGCYPTGLGAICPIAKELCSTFIENRKEILEKIGDFYFPNITDTEIKKERIKILMLTLDFDGSLEKWENDWKILEPQKLKNKQCNVKLNNSPHIFHLREYISNLPERTKWIADTVPEMVNLISQIKNGIRDRPTVTTKNFVLQELEAISREEKYNEAIRLGQIPLSLQHDGVVLGRTIRWDEESLKKILQLRSSEALGYNQPLEVKKMPSKILSPEYSWDKEKDTHTKIYKTKIEKWANKTQTSLKNKLEKKKTLPQSVL